MLLPLDVAAPPVASSTGAPAVLLLVPIVVVEALALYLLKWGGLGRSAIAALAMNIVSTLVGLPLLAVVANAQESDRTTTILLLLLPAWLLSTLIEAGVMWAFQRPAFRRTLGIAALANVASYVLLLGFMLLNSRS